MIPSQVGPGTFLVVHSLVSFEQGKVCTMQQGAFLRIKCGTQSSNVSKVAWRLRQPSWAGSTNIRCSICPTVSLQCKQCLRSKGHPFYRWSTAAFDPLRHHLVLPGPPASSMTRRADCLFEISNTYSGYESYIHIYICLRRGGRKPASKQVLRRRFFFAFYALCVASESCAPQRSIFRCWQCTYLYWPVACVSYHDAFPSLPREKFGPQAAQPFHGSLRLQCHIVEAKRFQRPNIDKHRKICLESLLGMYGVRRCDP